MRNLLLKISITLLVLVIGFSCEYFKLMSYNEWKQFIESAGSDDLAPVFPENTIFVASQSTLPDTTPDGTMNNPFSTISEAIDSASYFSASSTPILIAVQTGDYTENITLISNISIYGGYGTGWRQSGEQSHILNSGLAEDWTIYGSNTNNIELYNLYVQFLNSNQGIDSSTINITGSNIKIDKCTVFSDSNSSTGSSNAITISDPNNGPLNISNSTIYLSENMFSGTDTSTGIKYTGGGEISINGNTITTFNDSYRDHNYYGIDIAGSGTGGQNNMIENNEINLGYDYDSDTAVNSITGIHIDLPNAVTSVRNNRIYTSNARTVYGINLIDNSNTTPVLVYNNAVFVYAGDCTITMPPISINSSANIRLYNNTLYTLFSPLYQYASTMFNSTNTNTSLHPDIVNNIFYIEKNKYDQPNTTAVNLQNGITPERLHNNLFYWKPADGDTSADGTNFIVYNNNNKSVSYKFRETDKMTVYFNNGNYTDFLSSYSNKFSDPFMSTSEIFINKNWMKPWNSTIGNEGLNMAFDSYAGMYDFDINYTKRGASWTIGAME